MCNLLSKVNIIAAELSNFDIITISETYLDSSIDNNSLVISGFIQPGVFIEISVGVVWQCILLKNLYKLNMNVEIWIANY